MTYITKENGLDQGIRFEKAAKIIAFIEGLIIFFLRVVSITSHVWVKRKWHWYLPKGNDNFVNEHCDAFSIKAPEEFYPHVWNN